MEYNRKTVKQLVKIRLNCCFFFFSVALQLNDPPTFNFRFGIVVFTCFSQPVNRMTTTCKFVETRVHAFSGVRTQRVSGCPGARIKGCRRLPNRACRRMGPESASKSFLRYESDVCTLWGDYVIRPWDTMATSWLFQCRLLVDTHRALRLLGHTYTRQIWGWNP